MNSQAEFDKPSDVVQDPELSQAEKKKALENLEQDARQLMTASNEGMAPESDYVARHEPKLDEVVKAKQQITQSRSTSPRNKRPIRGASVSIACCGWRRISGFESRLYWGNWGEPGRYTGGGWVPAPVSSVFGRAFKPATVTLSEGRQRLTRTCPK